MFGAANDSCVCAAVSRFGVPAVAATRVRGAILKHSDVILRIALLCGALLGYAMSGLGR
jgi:hypothetical protein